MMGGDAVNVDERVYKLYVYLKDNPFNREEVSEFLEITPRQLSRLLNKWQEEEILDYSSGMGRGNASEVSFKINVESHFVNHLIHNIKTYDLQKLQEILQIPMSDSSRKLIKICIDESIFVKEKVQEDNHYHMEYLYHIPKCLDPLHPIDISLLTLLNNVADTLYISDKNELKSNIVIYDEWEGNNLIIHLYRNIRYSNGDILHASDVVHCIERLIDEKKNLGVYADILGVEVISASKLKIKLKKRKESIKWILSKVETSIYKVQNGQLIFTGPYKVDSVADDIMKIVYNPYYHHGTPDITSVIFVNDVKKYQKYYSRLSTREISLDESHNNDFLLFNPNTILSTDEREEIIYAIHCIMDGIKYEPRLIITKHFVLVSPKQSRIRNQSIMTRLNALFDTMEIIEISIEYYLEKHLDDLNADIILMSEVLRDNQYYYELLTSGKFIEWYYEPGISKNLLHVYNAKGADYWPYIEARYDNYMKENHLIVILDTYKKILHFPDNFENVMTDPYGIVYFNTIVIVNEDNSNDR